jgi:hypothetical protein
MADALLWCSLGIGILSISLAATCVLICSRLAFRCTRALKRKPPSESTLAQLAADQAALSSTFQSMATTVKRLSSRYGMEERRSRPAATDAPPTGASKAELRRHYGLNVSHREFAAKQLSLVPKE